VQHVADATHGGIPPVVRGEVGLDEGQPRGIDPFGYGVADPAGAGKVTDGGPDMVAVLQQAG
jgi:hypothetical protein